MSGAESWSLPGSSGGASDELRSTPVQSFSQEPNRCSAGGGVKVFGRITRSERELVRGSAVASNLGKSPQAVWGQSDRDALFASRHRSLLTQQVHRASGHWVEDSDEFRSEETRRRAANLARWLSNSRSSTLGSCRKSRVFFSHCWYASRPNPAFQAKSPLAKRPEFPVLCFHSTAARAKLRQYTCTRTNKVT